MMAELKSLTYEQARAEHFEALMKKEQHKIDWWMARENKLRPLDMASRSHIECSEAGARYSYYSDALEALEKQPKWISVEERLPPQSGKYLALMENGDCYSADFSLCDGDKGEFGFYDSYLDPVTLGSIDGRWFAIPDVTHWMPLPRMPEED